MKRNESLGSLAPECEVNRSQPALAAVVVFASLFILFATASAQIVETPYIRPVVVSEFDSADNKNAVYYVGTDSNIYQMMWDWGWAWNQDTGTDYRPSVA